MDWVEAAAAEAPISQDLWEDLEEWAAEAEAAEALSAARLLDLEELRF